MVFSFNIYATSKIDAFNKKKLTETGKRVSVKSDSFGDKVHSNCIGIAILIIVRSKPSLSVIHNGTKARWVGT